MPTTKSQQQSTVRSFAIVPSAGESRRMGVDKLLLPWRGKTLIDAVIDAWLASEVDAVVVVTNPDNDSLIAHLKERDVTVVVPATPPPDMKCSVQHALDYIARNLSPGANDVWLLAPADVPLLSPEVIGNVIGHASQSTREIIVPVCGPSRGHPALFRWRIADEVASLGETEGINALLDRHEVTYLECGGAAIAKDIDTPQEYDRLREDEA